MVKIQNFNRLESDLGASVVKTDVMNGQLKWQIAILVSFFNFVFCISKFRFTQNS